MPEAIHRIFPSVPWRLMAVLVTVFLAAAVAHAGAVPPRNAPNAVSGTAPVTVQAGPAIHIEDVYRFYRIYDAADGQPSAQVLQHEYLDRGSAGLHRLAELRNVTGQTIAKAIRAHPDMYANATRCMAVLPQVRERLTGVLHRFKLIYPPAVFKPVTIAVGRGKPVGVTDASGVMIGLEALCAVSYLDPNNVEDRFVHVIAHEYAHVQQALTALAFYDNPKPTVLQASLLEGAAEFMAELTSGSVAYTDLPAIAKGHEKEIETQFAADEDKTDLSAWLYNGTWTKPGDMGYWVGCRIVEAYYDRSADKRLAIREILEMNDAKAFLAASGWYPGIRLRGC